MKDKQRSTSQVEDKHTPGPWRATETGSIEHEKGILGEAYDFDSGYLGLKAESLPMIANARLMAAAPELLEALKQMYYACLAMRRPQIYKALANTRELFEKIEGDD